MSLISVILSGGVGSRLWPLSREDHPKPFMFLPDGQSLIQKAFMRACGVDDVVEVLTVMNQELFFKAHAEYRAADQQGHVKGFILEPFGRNTAAAVAVAALQLQALYGADAQMLVLAADHLIQDEAAFARAVSKAKVLADKGLLVTFGIKPTQPEVGFGYIEVEGEDLGGGFAVKHFVEKPDLQTAQDYIATGRWYWNSGIFCFRISTLLDELQLHAPDVLGAAAEALARSRTTTVSGHRCLTLDTEAFAAVPELSFDCAVMQRSNRVATIICDIGWSDIGSWSAVSHLTPADDQGNRFAGEIVSHRSRNNYVYSEERLMALVGVEDLLIVETPDAVLVAHKDHAQDVKHIVEQLKSSGHASRLLHRTVHRPWGTYTVLEQGERFKIKRIVVRPKASLSLQMHHHRCEHWIVVSGTALVVNDQQELMLNPNESTFILAGRKHRLRNPGVVDLVLIEVQSGDYLGEDDIVRFEDTYGRAEEVGDR